MKNVWLWIIAFLVAVIAALLFIMFRPEASDPGPGSTVVPTVTPTTPAPGPSGTPVRASYDVAPRPVTSADRLPFDVVAVTNEALSAVATRWVVAIHDTDAYDDAGEGTFGPSVLYLLSPTGVAFELVNLDTLGFDTPNIVAVDWDRLKVLLEEDRSELHVFDIESGVVESSWTMCGEGVSIRGEVRDGGWVLRGACEGTRFDGQYNDAGTLIPGAGIVGTGPGEAAYDIGTTQVVFTFEAAPANRFVAYYADGSHASLPTVSDGGCFPIGAGGQGTLAVQCYASGPQFDIWEVPADGSAAHQVISGDQIVDFQLVTTGSDASLADFGSYCRDTGAATLSVNLPEPRLGWISGGALVPGSAAPYNFGYCHGATGDTALVGGGGPLWLVNTATGTSVELLPGAGASYPLYVVGADQTNAEMHP